MSSRTCIAIAAGVLMASAVAAQSGAKLPRVAVLDPGSPTSPAVCPAGFRQGLRDLGYVEGRNVALDFRYANGQPERLSVLATEIVRLHPEVIWTHGADINRVMQVTTSIPIVFGAGAGVVERGIVASLARPGGNVTGMELRNSELMRKRLEVLAEAVPMAKRVAILISGLESVPESEAKALGISLQRVKAGGPDDFGAAFASMRRGGAEALIISDTAAFATNRQQLLSLALMNRLPTMSGGPHYADAGSLLSYGPDVREACRRSATLVDKILKGAKPASLPVEQADRFLLLVNLKTARKLGLSIPHSILLRADRVIE